MDALTVRMLDLTKDLAVSNSWLYNHTKACEELAELSTELLKKINKRGNPKEPSDQAVIDELGDVTIRLAVLVRMYGAEAVNKRVLEKIDLLTDPERIKKYKGSL
jgi:NTP pyrophosphatase (non-canonical NTP hydrolase)